MYKLTTSTLSLLFFMWSCKGVAQATGSANAGIFENGQQIKSDRFTGDVWVHMLVSADTTFNINAGHVTFAAGARTNWHIHPGGQVLMITDGEGRYQEKGSPVRRLRKGDVIKCTPNIPHWHGASPGSNMSHLAVGTNQRKGAVVWLAPVNDETYDAVVP